MVEYQVQTNVYNGPMDLLLYLIRREEVDIYDIPVARITEQYCQYVEALEIIDPNIAGDFLVLAAMLMELKSRMLLPRAVTENGEPDDLSDPRMELVRQLLAYKKFKDASFELGAAAELRMMRQPRVPVKITTKQKKAEVDLDDVQIWDLVAAFNKLMNEIGAGQVTHDVIFDDTPVALHAADILDRLQSEGGEMTFTKIFTGRNRAEMIGLFLALLELMRQQRLKITQAGIAGDIQISLLSADPIEVGDEWESSPTPSDEEDAAQHAAQREDGPEDNTIAVEAKRNAVSENGASVTPGEQDDMALPDEEGPQQENTVSVEDPRSLSNGGELSGKDLGGEDLDEEEANALAELDQINVDIDIDSILKRSTTLNSPKTEEKTES